MAVISIRRFLEYREKAAPAEISRLQGLLSEGLEAQRRIGREIATPEFELSFRELLHQLEEEPQPIGALNIANRALEILGERAVRAAEFFQARERDLRSMLGMLAETVAEISTSSDEILTRLKVVEKQLERASSLDDIRRAKERLAECLSSIKEAVNQQKRSVEAAVEQVEGHAENTGPLAAEGAPRSSGEGSSGAWGTTGSGYLAAFKLQRADHILMRIGERTVERMLDLLKEGLNPMLGPRDRIVRWKNHSLLLFLNSPEETGTVQRGIAEAVAKVGQRYVETGNSGLLAVGVDWVLLPQARYASAEGAMREVDLFLRKDRTASGPGVNSPRDKT
jgi:hypothetical protein